MLRPLNAKNGDIFGKLSAVDGRCVAEFLRSRHPTKTAACVEAETGIPADTFRKWEDGTSPSFRACFALIGVYGPELISAVMPYRVAWLDDAVMQSREQALLEEIETRQKQLCELRKRL